MKARIFILGADGVNADKNFDDILTRTFSSVLTDNAAVEHFSALKDATVSIGKAFSDSDTVLFFSDVSHLAETKEILCKALGMDLQVNEALLAEALKAATPTELDSAFFNVCHAGVPADAKVFALRDSLFSGFACKRGRQTVILLPLSGERTRVLLMSQVLPYLNETLSAGLDPAPLQFYYAEQLGAAAARENVKIAVASTKTAEVFLRYLSGTQGLAERVLPATKAESRGNTPPNEYVVNLSITAAEFMGVPYGVAISNAYYVGDDPEAPKTVYVAVTNDSETTVRELHSFYGEGTGDFLFRCCGELCRLLARIIDEDAGLAEKETAPEAVPETKKKEKKYKKAIAAVLVLILLLAGAGAWYFHSNSYTLQDWARQHLSFIPMFSGEEASSGDPSSESASASDTASGESVSASDTASGESAPTGVEYVEAPSSSAP